MRARHDGAARAATSSVWKIVDPRQGKEGRKRWHDARHRGPRKEPTKVQPFVLTETSGGMDDSLPIATVVSW
jgi:hypothetical protein